MARKVLNRKELRKDNDAAEKAEAKEKKPKKAAADGTKPKAKRKPKTPKEVRLKAFWGVFNQAMKRVAIFEYSERKKADKKAEELSTNQKTPHFVQLVKEVIDE
jgi:hypothetical protein